MNDVLDHTRRDCACMMCTCHFPWLLYIWRTLHDTRPKQTSLKNWRSSILAVERVVSPSSPCSGPDRSGLLQALCGDAEVRVKRCSRIEPYVLDMLVESVVQLEASSRARCECRSQRRACSR